MSNTTLNKRLKALNWLFAASSSWLFQGQASAERFPRGNDVEWDTLGDMGYYHNLEPLLYWVVSNMELPVEVPEWLKQKWEQAYFDTFVRNQEYLGVLELILDRCEREGTSIIVLKGPAMIGRIYKDPALRTMTDLDILCAEDDLGKLVDMAREMGYATMTPGEERASTYHVPMHHDNSRHLLEFHFRPYEVIRNHQLFMQAAWDGKEWIEVQEVVCPVLSMETELVFSIAHLVQHQFDVAVKHLLDVAGLLVFCRQDLNQERIYSYLYSAGLDQEFALAVRFLEKVFGLSLLLHGDRPAATTGLQRKFDCSLQNLLALLDQTRLVDTKGIMWNFRTSLSNRRNIKDKLAYIIKVLLPFSNDLAPYYGIRSKNDMIRYAWQRFLIYSRRLIQTLPDLPGQLLANKGSSLPSERASAKNWITGHISRRKNIRQ
jgi:hypothetical protein